jgi:hypothetical protein
LAATFFGGSSRVRVFKIHAAAVLMSLLQEPRTLGLLLRECLVADKQNIMLRKKMLCAPGCCCDPED